MKWVYCPKCRHKLFLVDLDGNIKMEIKCHSCKSINAISISNRKIKAVSREVNNVEKI